MLHSNGTHRRHSNSVKCAYRVKSFVLREAHGGDAVDGDGQDGDDQMDKCDPVGKKGPNEEKRTEMSQSGKTHQWRNTEAHL